MDDEIKKTIEFIQTKVIEESTIRAYKSITDRIKINIIKSNLVVLTIGEATQIVDDILSEMIEEAKRDTDSDKH